MTVTQQALAIARSPGQSLIVRTTPAGSPSEQALVLLRQAGGAPGRTRPTPLPVSWRGLARCVLACGPEQVARGFTERFRAALADRAGVTGPQR